MAATPFFAGQLTGYTNGTINVPDYQVELVVIGTQLEKINTNLLAQLTTLNQTINFNTGPLGVKTPGTVSASLNALATASVNIMDASVSMSKTQGEIVASLGALQTAVSRLSATVNSGVTTQQMALADQMQNNKFQQVTTNAALERSGLPPTEVPEETFVTKVEDTIRQTTDMKTQVFSANLIESGLQEAVAWTATTAQDTIAQTFIGAQVAAMWGTVKGWLIKTKPETPKIESLAAADGVKIRSQLGI